MTYSTLAKAPKISSEKVSAALDTAVNIIDSCLPKFASEFKNIFSEDGFYNIAPNTQWTNGFWTGQLWMAYELTGEDKFREAAMSQVQSFLKRIETGDHTDTHDLGFLYSLSCVAGYKLTGDETAKKAALMAADKLKSRFHEKGQFLQAWGAMDNKKNYRLIIDCLLNLPLLYWATEVTGDESYANIAKAHVQTALKVVIRPDYSTYHTFYFDPETGAPLRGETHQGYSADSAWSRGQSWGVYGIALSYRYTRNPEYLELFDKVADYFITHLPSNLIPYWDFIFEEGSDEPWDSSASAVTACGLLEMAKYVPEEKAAKYKMIALRLINALTDLCAVRSPEESNGLLLHGVYGKKSPYNDCVDHGIDECNLWGDYYYMEALIRLKKDWNPYW